MTFPPSPLLSSAGPSLVPDKPLTPQREMKKQTRWNWNWNRLPSWEDAKANGTVEPLRATPASAQVPTGRQRQGQRAIRGQTDWTSLLHRWPEPDEQHDVAEFAQCLVSTLDIQQHVTIRWQNRILTATGIDVTDDDSASVLVLGVSSSCSDLQGLITERCSQGRIRALSEPLPRLAIVQLGRFSGASKYSGRIECQSQVSFPVFCGPHAVDTVAVPYKLEAACVHRGALANSGHYQAILCGPDDVLHLTDDAIPARQPDCYTAMIYCTLRLCPYLQTRQCLMVRLYPPRQHLLELRLGMQLS